MLQLLNGYIEIMRGMNGMNMNDVINECVEDTIKININSGQMVDRAQITQATNEKSVP